MILVLLRLIVLLLRSIMVLITFQFTNTFSFDLAIFKCNNDQTQTYRRPNSDDFLRPKKSNITMTIVKRNKTKIKRKRGVPYALFKRSRGRTVDFSRSKTPSLTHKAVIKGHKEDLTQSLQL